MAEHYLVTIYSLCSLLALFSMHRLVLVRLKPHARPRLDVAALNPLPKVLIQVPLYNEPTYCERIIDAVCALDYPRELLEIQILDDSTDETSEKVAGRVRYWRHLDCRICHVQRPHRKGFKAGALADGLSLSDAEFVAIFDADFVPPTHFLKDTLPYFATPRVGMVQARWGHLNATHSLLTRAQSVLLNSHFLIEHQVRSSRGWFFNFNGTAGLWRISAIIDAGGWCDDTVTEDLDLSIRASMQGWVFRYVPHLVVPASLPEDIEAWRLQQDRWVCGGIQTAKKHLLHLDKRGLDWCLGRDDRLTLLVQNFAYLPLSLLVLLLPLYPYVVSSAEIRMMDLIFGGSLLFLGFFPMALFFWSGMDEKESYLSRGAQTALAVSLSGALVFNNFKAALKGMFGSTRQSFNRTPKGILECARERSFNPMIFADGLMGALYVAAFLESSTRHLWGIVPFMAILGFGFSYCFMYPLMRLGRQHLLSHASFSDVATRKTPNQV